MSAQARKNVVVEVFLKQGSSDRPRLDRFLAGNKVNVNIRRARVTSSNAWYRLEVSGKAAAVDAVVHRGEKDFVVVHPEPGRVA